MLPEEEIPHYWYNIQADMVNKPMPPLHPGTRTTVESRRPISDIRRRVIPPGAESNRSMDRDSRRSSRDV